MDATYIPDRGANGVIKGYFALVQDITERRQAEEEMRRWADAFEHCAHGIAIGDPTTNRIVVCNSAFAALHKSRSEDVVGSSILSLYAPDDHALIRASVTRSDQIGHVQYEAHMIRRDGSTFPVQVDLVSVRGDNGELLYRVATTQDISERKKAEQEIAYQANILAQVNDAVIASDENFMIKSWNAAAERTYGWKAEEVVGQLAEKILQTEFSGNTREEVIRQIKQTGEYFAEVTQARRDGTRVDVEAHTVSMHDESGRVTGFISVNRDITQRKRTEEEIRRLNEKLEERVIERTAQLHAANQELEFFSYSVSHDLRAPLRAINGYTRILLEDYAASLDAEGQRVCQVIIGETQRMGKLIDDLLAFSRLSRKEIQPAQVDMKSLALSAFGELTAEPARERIDFRIGRLSTANGDPALLHQVWINLLSNAIKFTSRRERAVIEIGSKRSDDQTVYYVRDNGAGFDIQYVDKMFGVFQRLHSEDEFEGTGVGLAIVQRIVQRHGGRVWAEGEVNKGATLYFSLPRERETQA